MSKREVPKKNYFILLLMIIMVVIVTFTIFSLNNKYNSKKLEHSYLNEKVTEVNLDEVKNLLQEPSSELFIYITKVGDEDIYKLETKLNKLIKKYNLRDNFLYMNADTNNIEEINKLFGSDIKVVPAILYIRNGIYEKGIDSENDLLSQADFEKLLDEYEVE